MLCYLKRPWGRCFRRYYTSQSSLSFETNTWNSNQSTSLSSSSSSTTITTTTTTPSKPSIRHKFSVKNSSHFKDSLQLQVVAGKGGDGCASFLREAHRPKGPPAGGNGGKGGDIIFVATPTINTLSDLKSKYLAPTGQAGRSRGCHGSHAPNLKIPVPLGTVLKELPFLSQASLSSQQSISNDLDLFTPSSSKSSSLESMSEKDVDEGLDPDSLYVRLNLSSSLSSSSFEETHLKNKEQDQEEETSVKRKTRRKKFDSKKRSSSSSSSVIVPPEPVLLEHEFTTPGEEFIVAKGGRGGFGNAHFSSSKRSSKHCEPGELGEHRRLYLELKLLADLGLVGLPNAGKSSLLQCLTQSNTKVAAYPFTTLTPHLGTLIWPDAAYAILADLPGLVEQAHENVGLGHAFLKHMERCPLFLLVLDVSRPDPVQDLCILLNEMEQYRSGLSQRPAIVVGNKADLGDKAKVGAQQLQRWVQQRQYQQFWPSTGLSSSSSSSSFSTWPVVLTSAKYHTNLPSLLLMIRQILESQSALRTYHPKPAL